MSAAASPYVLHPTQLFWQPSATASPRAAERGGGLQSLLDLAARSKVQPGVSSGLRRPRPEELYPEPPRWEEQLCKSSSSAAPRRRSGTWSVARAEITERQAACSKRLEVNNSCQRLPDRQAQRLATETPIGLSEPEPQPGPAEAGLSSSCHPRDVNEQLVLSGEGAALDESLELAESDAREALVRRLETQVALLSGELEAIREEDSQRRQQLVKAETSVQRLLQEKCRMEQLISGLSEDRSASVLPRPAELKSIEPASASSILQEAAPPAMPSANSASLQPALALSRPRQTLRSLDQGRSPSVVSVTLRTGKPIFHSSLPDSREEEESAMELSSALEDLAQDTISLSTSVSSCSISRSLSPELRLPSQQQGTLPPQQLPGRRQKCQDSAADAASNKLQGHAKREPVQLSRTVGQRAEQLEVQPAQERSHEGRETKQQESRSLRIDDGHQYRSDRARPLEGPEQSHQKLQSQVQQQVTDIVSLEDQHLEHARQNVQQQALLIQPMGHSQEASESYWPQTLQRKGEHAAEQTEIQQELHKDDGLLQNRPQALPERKQLRPQQHPLEEFGPDCTCAPPPQPMLGTPEEQRKVPQCQQGVEREQLHEEHQEMKPSGSESPSSSTWECSTPQFQPAIPSRSPMRRPPLPPQQDATAFSASAAAAPASTVLSESRDASRPVHKLRCGKAVYRKSPVVESLPASPDCLQGAGQSDREEEGSSPGSSCIDESGELLPLPWPQTSCQIEDAQPSLQSLQDVAPGSRPRRSSQRMLLGTVMRPDYHETRGGEPQAFECTRQQLDDTAAED
eukprot:TRINITY_DN7291_c0_g1_i1.p1 TRINITY_DN7291_c0_g1~~TRINITY_DN7291_c0_g1_i1.p1  ORF type:complete len:811 (+),score=156.23 TRINITY_DN7291_c0_g1_i1:32-2434(+)